MGSVGNQNPWTPYYDNYRDCSLGICSIYCPQFCNLIFPPPPIYDDQSPPFSPLIIAIIGVLASAFLLVSYYTIVTRFCNRRNVHNEENEENHVEMNHDQWPVQPVGLEENLIKAITVCKYKKGDGLIEGSECAVCLSEFQENESLRLLPKCDHAFHLPCIDTWLKSHSNCPLCRASVIVLANPVVNTNAYEVQQSNALVLVVDDHCEQRVVLSDHQDNDNAEDLDMKEEIIGNDQDGFRRSVSLGTFSDFGKNDEHLQADIGSSKGFVRSPAMERSISTGRFDYNGNHCILSN